MLCSSFVRIVSHIDADGICCAAIAKASLQRAGTDVEVMFLKSLTPGGIAELGTGLPPGGLVWLCDLGSGLLPRLEGLDCVITDHHRPVYASVDVPASKRRDILSFTQAVTDRPSTLTHLSPHEWGVDGTTEISGAGVTYLVAREMSPQNEDLAVLAIVGALGDQQMQSGKLQGANRGFMAMAIQRGTLSVRNDIALYGRETRDIVQLLVYANEPTIPGISQNEAGAREFFEAVGVRLNRPEGGIRHWYELDEQERTAVISGLVKVLLFNHPKTDQAKRLIGESYILCEEKEGSPLRDGKEFSTLLNSCGRYGNADVGLDICMGDRGARLSRGLELMKGHRANLQEFLRLIKEMGLTPRSGFSYFYTKDAIPEEVVGILVGILLGSGQADKGKPLFALADSSEPGMVKVSGRATRTLVDEGLDLSRVLKGCCEVVGGSGGGHDIAAGGIIPKERMEEFLVALEKRIGNRV